MKLIEAKPKEKPTFYFYQYEGEKFKEIGYLFKIEGTNMGVFLTSISPMKDVKERLGHSDIQTTMNIYTHVTQESRNKSAELFATYVNF